MPRAKLTSKGQITLPKEIRDYLDLKPGDRLDFQIRDGGAVVLEPHTVDFLSLAGILKRPGQRPVSVEEMNEAILQYAADDYDRIRHQYSGSTSRKRRSRAKRRR